jgi:hypothetical protein
LVYDLGSVSVNYFLITNGQNATDGNPRRTTPRHLREVPLDFLEFLHNPYFITEDEATRQMLIAMHVLHHKAEKVPSPAIATFFKVTKGTVRQHWKHPPDTHRWSVVADERAFLRALRRRSVLQTTGSAMSGKHVIAGQLRDLVNVCGGGGEKEPP